MVKREAEMPWSNLAERINGKNEDEAYTGKKGENRVVSDDYDNDTDNDDKMNKDDDCEE